MTPLCKWTYFFSKVKKKILKNKYEDGGMFDTIFLKKYSN